MPQSIGDCTPAGGGTWALDRPEELADEAVGRPAGERDRAAGPADAEQLGGRLLVVGSEHGAEHRRDGVEGRILERQRLGVALEQLDGEAFGVRPAAAALEQRRDVVDADGSAAVARRGDRGVAAAGGDVEDAPAGLEVGGVAEVLGDEHDPGGDDGEVAARPGRLLALLDGAEVGGGGVQRVGHRSPSGRRVRTRRSTVRPRAPDGIGGGYPSLGTAYLAVRST